MRISIDELLERIANSNTYEKTILINSLRVSPEYSIAEKKKLYDRLESSSAYFARVCFGHIVKAIPDFHYDIYNSFDDESLTYLGIVVFRQAAKSTLKVIKVCQLACTQKSKYTLLISETEDQAFEDLTTIKDEFESNEIIKLLYFNGKSASGDTWSRGTMVLLNGVIVRAKGMNSRMRGMKYKFQRPDHVMLDDFESEDNSHNDIARADVSNKISAVIIPLGDVITRFIFFNTLPNDKCFMATEIAKDDGIFSPCSHGKFIKYQITTMINGVETPTWSRYNWEWIRLKKQYYISRNELHIWLQEFHNIPSNISEPKIDVSMIKPINATFHAAAGIKYLEYPNGRKVNVATFTGVDPASTVKAKSDNSVIFTIAVTPSDDIVIISCKVRKMKTTDQPIAVLETLRNYQVDNGTIECTNYQLSLFDHVEKMMYDLDEYYPISQYNKTKSKDNKFIEGLEPIINTGKVSYLQDCEGIDIFLKEVACYSGGIREHDDTMDGLYLALCGKWTPGDTDIDEYLETAESFKNSDFNKSRNYKYDWTTA